MIFRFQRIQKKVWQRVGAVILGLLLPIMLVACNAGSIFGTKVMANQVVSAILNEPKTFNAILSAESPNIFGLTYEGLTSENPITGKIEPALAESWEFSEDKLHLTFTIKENLKWSDGEPLTADDVVFTYNQLYLNEAIPNNARDGLRIGVKGEFPKVKKVGDRQVEFAITEPFAPFLDNTSLPIMPEHSLKKSVETKDEKGNPEFISKWRVDTNPAEMVFSGAYVLKEYVNGQRLIFTANPYYWKKGEHGEQLPYIKRYIWQIVQNTDTSLIQFRSGNLDSIGISPEYFSLLKKEEKRGKFTIYNGGSDYGTSFIAFNLNTGKRDGKPLVDPIKSRWFNNVNFRRAVAYAIDRQRMINNIYRGLGEMQDSPISVQSPFYDKTVKRYDYNSEKAKQLLLESGFVYDSEGNLFDDQGNRINFTLLTNAGNKIREAMGTQIKQDLEAIGIKVDFSPISFNILVDKLMTSLDWECHLLSLTGGNEPHGGANVWFPDGNLHLFNQVPPAGTKPLSDRQIAPWEKRIGDLYIAGARELDFAKRKVIYDETQQLTQEYLPLIHLVNNYALGAIRDRIQGVQYSALGGGFWNLEQLKLATETNTKIKE